MKKVAYFHPALRVLHWLMAAAILSIYSMLDNSRSGANITHAFIVALLAMAICLAAGAGLSIRFIRRACALHPAATSLSIE